MVHANITPLLPSFNMSDKQILVAKNVIRKKLYSTINSLSKDEIMRQSKIVTEKVLRNKEFQKAKVVSIYLSMDNEIQTEDLVRQIFKQGKECFIPRFQVGSPLMEMIRLSSMEQYFGLPKNKWNIKQHPDGQKFESVFDRGQLDLVLTPGLGFTRDGYRLGRGKGYYDKFFLRCQRELPNFPFTIGLAFNEQILSEIPTEDHDIPLNLVIGPQ